MNLKSPVCRHHRVAPNVPTKQHHKRNFSRCEHKPIGGGSLYINCHRFAKSRQSNPISLSTNKTIAERYSHPCWRVAHRESTVPLPQHRLPASTPSIQQISTQPTQTQSLNRCGFSSLPSGPKWNQILIAVDVVTTPTRLSDKAIIQTALGPFQLPILSHPIRS